MLAHTTFMTATISFVPLSFCMHTCIFVHASCNNQSSVSISESKCSSATQPVTSVLSVIGVYLPCLNLGLDCFREHLQELERVISDAALVGAVAVLGDFNAHQGSCGGSRGVGELNIQGVLLQELMDRCRLSAVSLGSVAKGPKHTYCGGENHTTADYIQMDLRASASLASCLTHEMADLNTSDHLPITASMLYEAQTGKDEEYSLGAGLTGTMLESLGK